MFLLDYWIDCRAFDTSRDGLQARNLTPDVDGMVDAFDQSPLKDICEHDKGALKYGRNDGSIQETVRDSAGLKAQAHR